MAPDVPPWNVDFLDLLDCMREAHVEFMIVAASRVERPIGGGIVAFLGRDALIKNKRASARPKELADIAALEALAAKRRG